MSDVPGDTISEIAGSPTVNDFLEDNVKSILTKYNLNDTIPISIKKILEEDSEPLPQKMLDVNGKFKFVDYHIIAGISDALDGMAKAAFKLGYIPIKVSSSCVGPVQKIAEEYAKFTSLMILAVEEKISKLEFYNAMNNSTILPLTEETIKNIFPSKEKWGLGLCLLMGGRPLVKITDVPGQGGPNQELALYFSIYWYLRCRQYPILKEYVVWFLGGSSSGKDGNSQVAGAYGYSDLVSGIYKTYEECNNQYREEYCKIKKWKEQDPDSIEAKVIF